MKIIILGVALVLFSAVSFAQETVYEVIKRRTSSCYRNDLICKEGVRNAVIYDVQTHAANHCKNEFGNKAKVVDWDAYCSAYAYGPQQTPPIPPPPQMPDFPITVNCTAKVIYTCE